MIRPIAVFDTAVALVRVALLIAAWIVGGIATGVGLLAALQFLEGLACAFLCTPR